RGWDPAHCPRRRLARRAAEADLRARWRADGAPAQMLLRCAAAGDGEARHPAGHDERAHATGMAPARSILRVTGLSGADAAGGRSRTPLPVHLEPVAVAGGADQRPRYRRVALCSSEGSKELAAVDSVRP